MKDYLIGANQKIVSAVELADGMNGIRRLIGYDWVDSEEIDASGDRLCFDEGYFLRDQTGKGRFGHVSLVVADNAVIVGSSVEGTTLRDTAT